MTLRKKYGAKEFYVYTVPFGAIGANAALAGQFTVEPACDFLWQKFSVVAVITGDPNSAYWDRLNLQFTVTDSSTGKILSNNKEYIDGLAGNGGIPFILPTPKLIAGRGSVVVNVYNTGTGPSAQTFDAFYFMFIGTQLFAR